MTLENFNPSLVVYQNMIRIICTLFDKSIHEFRFFFHLGLNRGKENESGRRGEAMELKKE